MATNFIDFATVNNDVTGTKTTIEEVDGRSFVPTVQQAFAALHATNPVQLGIVKPNPSRGY